MAKPEMMRWPMTSSDAERAVVGVAPARCIYRSERHGG